MNWEVLFFHSSFCVHRSSFQLVLRAAQQAADVGSVHVDDQCAASERDREQWREASRRRSRAPKYPDAERHTRGGRDRTERDVARAPDDEQEDNGDDANRRRREREKDAETRRHAFAAAKLEPDREAVPDDGGEGGGGDPPADAEVRQ